MSPAEIEEIRLAGLLHDIGKVGIPEAILNKAAPLDASEWETMKTHTELGAEILKPLEPMARISEMLRHHHEFYDGTGYPARLRGPADSARGARDRYCRRLRHNHVQIASTRRPGPPTMLSRNWNAAPQASSIRKSYACSSKRCGARPAPLSNRAQAHLPAEALPLQLFKRIASTHEEGCAMRPGFQAASHELPIKIAMANTSPPTTIT